MIGSNSIERRYEIGGARAVDRRVRGHGHITRLFGRITDTTIVVVIITLIIAR